MNDGLVNFLMVKRRLTREKAQKRAEFIIAQQAERAAAKKVRLAQAQTLLPLDGAPDEEPISKWEQDPSVPF